MHNYYAQPIYYTDVSKLCESLTDWSIPLTGFDLTVFCYYEQPRLYYGLLDSMLWITRLRGLI